MESLWNVSYKARPGSTLHALVRIPGTLQLAHVHDLAGVICVVGAEVANRVRPSGELLIVSRFHKSLKVGHDLVELMDDVDPLPVVESVEGFLVVSGKVVILNASKVIQIATIPKQQMVGELPCGWPPVGAASWPVRLLGPRQRY